MLNRQPQPPRAGRTEHQPVCPQRKVLLRQRLAEQGVIGPKIINRDAALGYARRPAGLKYVNWIVRQCLWYPTPHRAAAQPVVLKRRELSQVFEGADIRQWIELQLALEFEPERAASRFVKVPRDYLNNVRVQGFACTADGIGWGVGHGGSGLPIKNGR